MIRNRKNQIAKDVTSDSIALPMNPDADHDSVLEKGASAFGLNPTKCSLVQLSGSKITNDDTSGSGYSYQWSLGRYLKSAYSRPTTYRIGILYESDDECEVN